MLGSTLVMLAGRGPSTVRGLGNVPLRRLGPCSPLALSDKSTCTTLFASCLLSIHLQAGPTPLMPQPLKQLSGVSDIGLGEFCARRTLHIKLLLSPLDAIKAIFPSRAAQRCATFLWHLLEGAPGERGDWLYDRLLADRHQTGSLAACFRAGLSVFPEAGTAG